MVVFRPRFILGKMANLFMVTKILINSNFYKILINANFNTDCCKKILLQTDGVNVWRFNGLIFIGFTTECKHCDQFFEYILLLSCF